MLIPERLPSLVYLVGCWVPPAAMGWAAADLLHRNTKRVRPALIIGALATLVVAWAAVWFFFQLGSMPPYIPGVIPEDPTFAPPGAVRGLLVFTGALVLPVSALACGLAFRSRRRSLRIPT